MNNSEYLAYQSQMLESLVHQQIEEICHIMGGSREEAAMLYRESCKAKYKRRNTIQEDPTAILNNDETINLREVYYDLEMEKESLNLYLELLEYKLWRIFENDSERITVVEADILLFNISEYKKKVFEKIEYLHNRLH